MHTCTQDMGETVIVNLKSWLTDPETANNPTLQLIAGIIYIDQGEYEEAAKVLHAGTTLEMVSLQVCMSLAHSLITCVCVCV
jgi:hypothetical protein